MQNKHRILITDCIHDKDDFFVALDKVRSVCNVPSPKNLDAMADFLVDAGIDRITCSNWVMNDSDSAAVNSVLSDIGVKLFR